MPLSNIIALIITTAMGLPDMIVSAITLYRTLKPGHGRHRKRGQRHGPAGNRGATPLKTTNKQSPGVWARAGGPAPTPQEHQEGTR